MSETVTYEEMDKARDNFQQARMEFHLKYHNFLTTVLQEAGVYKKLVKIKDSNLVGIFQVSDDPYDRRPCSIKFFPITRTGAISMKSKYLNNFYSWREDSLVEQLKSIAEELGEAPCK